MALAYLGEIRIFSFDYSPRGWLPCNGQLLSIGQNESLYMVFGTTYGGDGKTTFALPNLQGRATLSAGDGSGGIGSYTVGQTGGNAAVTLTGLEVPVHTHEAQASSARAENSVPSSRALPAASSDQKLPFYTAQTSQFIAMASNALATNAGGDPHPNVQPSLVLNFCVCVAGPYPSKN